MPERCIKELFSTRGSAIVMALLIFLIISVLAVSVISVAAMENKISLYDANKEQARMAADAGVEVARNVILNYLGAGKTVADAGNALNTELDLGNGGFARVTLDNSEYESKGIIKITSRGKLQKSGEELAHRTAEAKIFINVIPNMAVQTNEFKILGKYYTKFDSLPYYKGGKLLKNGRTEELPLYGPEYPADLDITEMSWNPLKPDPAPASIPNPDRRFWYIDYKYSSNWPHWVDFSATRYHVFSYMKPQGRVNIRNTDGTRAKVAINDWAKKPADQLSPDEYNDLFYKVPTIDEQILKLSTYFAGGMVINHMPERKLNSYDFIGDLEEVAEITRYPKFGDEELQRYRELAQESARWAYLTTDAPAINNDGGKHVLTLDEIINPTNPNYIGKPCIFVDLKPEDTILLDFRTYNSSNITIPDGIFIKWSELEPYINDINNKLITFLRLFSNDLTGITIVTPANINAAYDSMVFESASPSGETTAVALLSGKNITFDVDPKTFNGVNRIFPDQDPEHPSRVIRTYLLAGEEVYIRSTPKELTIKGIISSHDRVTVKVDYWDEVKISEIDKLVHIIHDPSVVNDFPEPMAYLGIGPIISYKYIK